MNGKSLSLPVGTIQVFYENTFHFYLVKIGTFGNPHIIPVLTPIQLFGIDIAKYPNDTTNIGDMNEKFPN